MSMRPGVDIGQQALQGRALQRAAGDAAIIIAGVQQLPALVPLAGDIGGAGLVLRVERVEVLLEPVFGGFAGVDGAADLWRGVIRLLPWSARRSVGRTSGRR